MLEVVIGQVDMIRPELISGFLGFENAVFLKNQFGKTNFFWYLNLFYDVL